MRLASLSSMPHRRRWGKNQTAEAWPCLCIVIDLSHHEVVSWSMSRTQDRSMAINAVLIALWQRKGGDPVVLHSDRGAQFTSNDYQQFLADHIVL
ncbi:DDE-type integrase/transposase/recombinase [Guyparkeria sp.]|uniref:DDE-type integrase/transposase/recombinase n=1 Tax=Guyparkeria sp. TaxID=2035736 RepID=UPI0039707CA0